VRSPRARNVCTFSLKPFTTAPPRAARVLPRRSERRSSTLGPTRDRTPNGCVGFGGAGVWCGWVVRGVGLHISPISPVASRAPARAAAGDTRALLLDIRLLLTHRVHPAPASTLVRVLVVALAAPLRLASAPQDQVAPLAARQRVRTMPVVAAVQDRDAGAVVVRRKLVGRRARLLMLPAAHAAEEERAAFEGAAEADVECDVTRVHMEFEVEVLAQRVWCRPARHDASVVRQRALGGSETASTPGCGAQATTKA
jgi:hypothetical protein